MSAASTAVLVFNVTLALGHVLWKQGPIHGLLHNQPVRLVLTGSHAAVLGNALKAHLPTITWEPRPMTVTLVFVISVVLSLALVQPLVDVLNTAFNRGYEVRVRYKKKGSGVLDDELIFELQP